VTPRRITYVITDLETGGVPLHLLRLATAIRDRGWLPKVISLAPPGPVSAQLHNARIPVDACHASGPSDIAVLRRLAVRLRHTRPHLVHSFLFHANTACRLAAPLAGVSYARLICEIQTVEIERPWHLVVGGMLHRLGTCIVCNSPSVLNHLQRHAYMAPGRLRLVEGGVDVDRIRRAPCIDRKELGIENEHPIVLWAGRLDPVKGLDELVEAFAETAAATDAHLLFAGDGAYEHRVRALIERHALRQRAHLLGRRDDVASLLKLADLFVLPSRTEGLPNALLEAMAARKPIVTTDVPGCRDLIRHERNGLLVPPRNAPLLADAMIRLLTDETTAARLAATAAETVDARFTFERCITRYNSLYHDIAERVPYK
jgi:starch synthase (maltosyl-transferring)